MKNHKSLIDCRSNGIDGITGYNEFACIIILKNIQHVTAKTKQAIYHPLYQCPEWCYQNT
jgi:hypothetical protein